MARFLMLILLSSLSLAGLQALPGSAHAQSPATTGAAPRAAWPAPATSGAPSQPRSAWPAAPGAGSAPVTTPSYGANWWRFVLDMQQKMLRQLSDAVKGLKAGSSVGTALTLVVVSFIYGVFHAVGPGHGKAVISSYVVANRVTVWRGVLLSVVAAIVQAFSAILLVSVFAIALHAAGLQIQEMVRRFETVSGVLILLTGLWLLSSYLRRRLYSRPAIALAAAAGHDHDHHHHDHDDQHHHGDHHHHHDEACDCGHAHMPDARELEKNWSLTNAAAMVLAIGIRPCTGAILILVFALTQGMFWAGVGATFAMALGTAITVSAIAVLAVASRDLALRFGGSRWTTGISDFAAVGGSLLVMLLGTALFLSALGPANPF